MRFDQDSNDPANELNSSVPQVPVAECAEEVEQAYETAFDHYGELQRRGAVQRRLADRAAPQ